MKNKYLFLSLMCAFAIQQAYPQGVAVSSSNADPAPSAMLDVQSADKGLLVPRVALTGTSDVATIPAPAVSLLIYNTNTAGNVTPGFYYWSGSAWTRLAIGGVQVDGWTLAGNSGTNPDFNFIGTTDNQPLRFRVDNHIAGLIGTAGSENLTLGYDAGLPLLTGTGIENTLVGFRAGSSTSSGIANSFFGGNAGRQMNNGSINSFFGFAAGEQVTGSIGNSFFGTRAGQDLFGSTENFNTFIGAITGSDVFDATENTLLGALSGVANARTNATAIGCKSQVDASNCLVLGSISGVNGAIADVNVGIGTTTPDTKLEIAGSSGVTARLTSANGTDVNFDFKRLGSDWRIHNTTGLLFFGQSSDDLATVGDVLRLGGASVTPAVDNTVTLGSSTNRWTQVFAVNGVINTSDARLKENISGVKYGLDAVMKMQPVTFTWKEKGIDQGKNHIGFLAQDIRQVIPEAVVDHEWREKPDSRDREWVPAENLGVSYSEITPVLVKAIQEQQKMIEQLKWEIASLRTELNKP
jgi:hypothetical protein